MDEKERKAKKRRLRRIELKERLYQRRFLVPNLVTLANMFCGFLTIIYASSDRFEKAAIAIGIAILLDGLDGRVARRLNATSQFGVEFDSFSDLVSFGIAPAMLMYHWCFQQRADEFGVMVCFVFALCAAGRLARFNISSDDLNSFLGLPTPGAAGMVAAIVHFLPRVEQDLTLVVVGTVLLSSLSFLMISHIAFFSVKRIQMGNVQLPMVAILGGTMALIWYNSGIGFLVLATLYCLSGPGGVVLQRFRKKTSKSQAEVERLDVA